MGTTGVLVKLNFITLTFALITALPRGVKAETLTISDCLRDIQTNWVTQKIVQYKGQNRTETSCELQMSLSKTGLKVVAVGLPHYISFELKDSTEIETRTLQTCRMDNEKFHLVFEEKTSNDFEKRERVQMTLLKRHGKGISLILSKRENKILRPLQQSNLICHLN